MSDWMPLADFADKLEELAANLPEAQVRLAGRGEAFAGSPHSYRGYYEQLAIEPGDSRKAREISADVADYAEGKTLLEGWKGGEYRANLNEPVWIAYEGCTSSEVVHTIYEMDGDIYISTITVDPYTY